MAPPERDPETSPSSLPWGERLGKFLESLKAIQPGARPAEEPLRLAFRLDAEAQRHPEDSFEFGIRNLRAAELYEESAAWTDAEGAYARAFDYFKTWYPTFNRDQMAEGLIKSGLGLERCLKGNGQRSRALAVHAELEKVAGIEIERPLVAQRF